MTLISSKTGQLLQKQGIELTPERLRIMAKHCQDDVLDIRDVCEIYTTHVTTIKNCEKNISAKCGIHVSFSEEAIDRILARSPLNSEIIEELCASLSKSLEYGLELLEQKKGVDHIVIPGACIDDPEQYINDLVRDFFRT
jgi:hypothetical protein